MTKTCTVSNNPTDPTTVFIKVKSLVPHQGRYRSKPVGAFARNGVEGIFRCRALHTYLMDLILVVAHFHV